jgi:hypothetical protein
MNNVLKRVSTPSVFIALLGQFNTAKLAKYNYFLLLFSFFWCRIVNFISLASGKVRISQQFLPPTVAKSHAVGSCAAILMNVGWFFKLGGKWGKISRSG